MDALLDTGYVSVSASRDGWRRAGRAWTRAPQVVAVDDLPAGALEALAADRSMVVAPAPAPADPVSDAPADDVDAEEALLDAVLAAGYVSVSATRDGFRRAGRTWTRAPQVVAVDDLIGSGLQALITEACGPAPALVVQPAPAPADPTPHRSQDPTAGDDPPAVAEPAGGDPARRQRSEPLPQGVDPEAGSAPPSGEPVSEPEIAAAIAQLDPVALRLWTASGKPRVDAIEAVLGRDITVAQRDAAWRGRQEPGD